MYTQTRKSTIASSVHLMDNVTHITAMNLTTKEECECLHQIAGADPGFR